VRTQFKITQFNGNNIKHTYFDTPFNSWGLFRISIDPEAAEKELNLIDKDVTNVSKPINNVVPDFPLILGKMPDFTRDILRVLSAFCFYFVSLGLFFCWLVSRLKGLGVRFSDHVAKATEGIKQYMRSIRQTTYNYSRLIQILYWVQERHWNPSWP
jgi:hypothetical protein